MPETVVWTPSGHGIVLQTSFWSSLGSLRLLTARLLLPRTTMAAPTLVMVAEPVAPSQERMGATAVVAPPTSPILRTRTSNLTFPLPALLAQEWRPLRQKELSALWPLPR